MAKIKYKNIKWRYNLPDYDGQTLKDVNNIIKEKRLEHKINFFHDVMEILKGKHNSNLVSKILEKRKKENKIDYIYEFYKFAYEHQNSSHIIGFIRKLVDLIDTDKPIPRSYFNLSQGAHWGLNFISLLVQLGLVEIFKIKNKQWIRLVKTITYKSYTDIDNKKNELLKNIHNNIKKYGITEYK